MNQKGLLMTFEERAIFIERFLNDRCKVLLETKGEEYARDSDDSNANFKRLAEQLKDRDIDKYDILFVYLTKHIDGLVYWFNTRKIKSEPIEERVADIINYLLIFVSMLEEDRKGTIKSV